MDCLYLTIRRNKFSSVCDLSSPSRGHAERRVGRRFFAIPGSNVPLGRSRRAVANPDILKPPVEVCCRAQVLFEAQGRGAKNKAVDLEDMKFHQCVRLARFENDRTISFIPPDGAFDLM